MIRSLVPKLAPIYFLPCALHSPSMLSSSSSPPSCSSGNSGRSLGSQKRVFPSVHRVRDRVKQDVSRETITIDKAGRECEGDDEISIKSKSSSGISSAGTSSSTQSALDALRLIAGSGIRRSKCRAEFLEKLAQNPQGLSVLDKDVAERLRLLIGKEAVACFRKFVGWVLTLALMPASPLHLTFGTVLTSVSPLFLAVCCCPVQRRVT